MSMFENLVNVVEQTFPSIDVDELMDTADKTVNSVKTMFEMDNISTDNLLEDTINLLTPKMFPLTSENVPLEEKLQFEEVYNKYTNARNSTIDEIKALNIFQKYKESIPQKAVDKVLEYVQGGDSFRDSVKKYQQELGVVADGYFGKKSIAASRSTEKTNTAPIPVEEESYTVKKGDTLSKISQQLGVPLSSLTRTSKSKYLQIGEQIGIKGHKKELVDFGGTEDNNDSNALSAVIDDMTANYFKTDQARGALDSNTYQGKFREAMTMALNPFSTKSWNNKDFSNTFLNKLYTVAEAAGKNMKVGESKIISPEFVSRYFGYDHMGYGNGNIQKDTGDKEVDLMRKGLGNFTLIKTKEGFKIKDVYDFKRGTDEHIKGEEDSLFRVAHRLGEQFLSDDEGDGIKVNITLPFKNRKYTKA